MDGLFREEEMSSENIKDKESKQAFLQKVIDVLKIIIPGEKMPEGIKTSKIVAGLEVEKTNIFLQILALAVIQKKDSIQAVRSVLGGDNNSSTTIPEGPPKTDQTSASASVGEVKKQQRKTSPAGNKATTSKSSIETTGSKSPSSPAPPKQSSSASSPSRQPSPRTSRNGSAGKTVKGSSSSPVTELSSKSGLKTQKTTSAAKIAVPVRKKVTAAAAAGPSSPSNKASSSSLVSANSSQNNVGRTSQVSRPPDVDSAQTTDHISSGDRENEEEDDRKLMEELESKPSSSSQKPQSSSSSSSKVAALRPPTSSTRNNSSRTKGSASVPQESIENHNASMDEKPIARPTTARAAPPRVRMTSDEMAAQMEKSNSAAEEERALRLMSAKPRSDLITETTAQDDNDEEDEDDLKMFMVQEEKTSAADEDDIMKGDDEAIMTMGQTSSSSGQQEKGVLLKQLMETKQEFEGSKVQKKASDDELLKSGITQLDLKDFEKLRASIQSLSKFSHPVNRILDYMQEDLDLMFKELKSWQDVYENNNKRLEDEKKKKHPEIEVLKDRLNQLDQEILDQTEKISSTKANIERQNDKLKKMISLTVMSGH